MPKFCFHLCHKAHFSGYAFHISNPDDVLRGAKPKLEERGPYVYAADTVKDSEGMIWSGDSTDLTYRDFQKRDPMQCCQMAKFDPFLSLDCARVEDGGPNPRKGRDQILQHSVAEPKFRSPKGQTPRI